MLIKDRLLYDMIAFPFYLFVSVSRARAAVLVPGVRRYDCPGRPHLRLNAVQPTVQLGAKLAAVVSVPEIAEM